MSAKVETTIRQWSTPVQKVVEGQPPRPEDNPTTITGEARRADIRTITPSYKYGSEKSSYEMRFGSAANLPEAVGDYKVKETQDHFKLQIIDPKVTSNANMPASSQSVPAAYRRNLDFPSEHSKRSFLKLEPMEQRKIRATQTRPITTSAYLTESVDRHREMEASRLREYLKAKESDANKPWNKPDWPGPKARQDNEQSIRELEEIKRTIESLQRAANEPKKNSELDELARLNEKLLERSRGRRADYKLVDSEIIKTAPEPVPPSLKQPQPSQATVIQEQIREMLESRISNDASVGSTVPQQDRSGYVTDVSSATWQFSTQSFSPRSVVSINGGTRTDDGLLRVRTDLSPNLSRTLSRSNAAVQTAHLTETEKQQWPYMPTQLGEVADSSQSTMTREYNESFSRRFDRYASLPTLNAASDARGTLIKIKDDKPRGIMKRRELETKDQMMYVDHQPNNVASQDHWEKREVIQARPKVTETVQKFEEHKRTEEIERRIQRKEKREKKHRSAQRSYHHSGGQDMLGYSDGEEIRRRRERMSAENELLRREAIERHYRSKQMSDYSRQQQQQQQQYQSKQRPTIDSYGSDFEYERHRRLQEQKRLEYERRQADEERRRAELERQRLKEQQYRRELESRSERDAKLVEEHDKSESLRITRSAQTDAHRRARSRSVDHRPPIRRIERIYEQRHYSPSELNEAVRNAYKAVEQAQRDLRYRSSSLSRSGGYLPAHESYTRTVTTRREKDGRYSDDGRASNRYGGSISDSLRRGEMKYNPNGEIREVHRSSLGRNGNNVHKSYSTRDVFDSGHYDDRRSSLSYRRGSQQGSGGPFVEFPPTLPRVDREPPMPPPHRGRSASNDFYRPITKSRSYADWDEGRGFSHAIRRRDDDIVRLENEFRDSLLMPLPTGTGNMYEKDHRREQIPGGYETYDREVKANSGRRLNREGKPTQFSEASQEYSYKREQESDRRR